MGLMPKQCKKSDSGKHQWTSDVMKNHKNGTARSTGVRVIYCGACGRVK